MKRWLMLFSAVLAISLFVSCKQDTSDDTGGDNHFVEGWWQCDFQARNKMWVKYNAEKIGIKCLSKVNNMSEIADITNTLQPSAFYYTWDTMKKFAQNSSAKRFVHIAESEVPNIGSGGGSGSGGSGSGSGGGDETNPAAVAGWYKIPWSITFPSENRFDLYLLYNSSGKLQRIGTSAQETSINNLDHDYGEYAHKLKDYKNYELLLKNEKITDPAQWPVWAK